MRRLEGKNRAYLSFNISLVYLYKLFFEKPKFLRQLFLLEMEELSEIETNVN